MGKVSINLTLGGSAKSGEGGGPLIRRLLAEIKQERKQQGKRSRVKRWVDDISAVVSRGSYPVEFRRLNYCFPGIAVPPLFFVFPTKSVKRRPCPRKGRWDVQSKGRVVKNKCGKSSKLFVSYKFLLIASAALKRLKGFWWQAVITHNVVFA